ncbi:M23 family metallopeptidase [Streptomyces sp. NPDC050617]|uniref:M23 family metallopeptidase n=1 Tax=Streptomyces sp. NPDC050617 TaxID=3154628 RepID=UPI00341430E0
MATSINLEYPFAGRWLVQNSPADRVPSNGTTLFAQSYAIDFVPLGDTGRTAPVRFASLVRPEPPERFPGFGRPVLAPAHGVVLAVHDAEADPRPALGRIQADSTPPGLGGLGCARRQPRADRKSRIVVVLCHLRHRSVAVRPGQRVLAGDLLGRCGNSGNSTEPHVHVQTIDNRDVEHANSVPMTFGGCLPRSGEVITAQSP